jgi:aryl carrier-like protein
MIAAIWYVSMSTAALYILIYYVRLSLQAANFATTLTENKLPVWFQAIKKTTAALSGTMLLPTEVGIVVFALLGGFLVTRAGFYTPFLMLSSVATSTGSGLLSTLQPNSGIGKWLGYQVLLSAGAGLGAQNALLVPQVALFSDDIVTGITVLTSVQIVAGSVALAIGESIFQGRLNANLRASHVTVKNYYGPAECSSVSHCTVNPSTWNSGDIGQPDAVLFWVANPENHDLLVPVGAIGELLVEGPTLSSGFINRGDEGAFVYPKWLAQGNAAHCGRRGRVYKTGDLVRQTVHGTFVYVGRKDAQVKIRGQRVELSEVEYFLNRHLTDGSEVTAAAEVVTPLNGTKPILVGFLAIGDAANDENEARLKITKHTQGLMHNLASKLHAYMVPNAFIPVDSIPTTATSKINRRMLREIGAKFSPEQLARLNSSVGDRRRKPETSTECIIQKLWATLLRVQENTISLDDNFLVLGGDSIKAMKFVRTAQEHGLNLAVTDVFLHPRLIDLASVAIGKIKLSQEFDFESLFSQTKQQLIHSGVLSSLGLSSHDLIQVFPVSDFQKFYVSALEQDTLEKFAHCYIDLPDGLHVSDIVINCEKLWNHLDNLRIVFIMVHGTPVQALFRGLSPSIDVHEVQGDLVEASEKIYCEDFHRAYQRGRPVTHFIITHTHKMVTFDLLCVSLMRNLTA